MPGNGHVRFGGRPCGKGPAVDRRAPRCMADPARTVREQFLVEITPAQGPADLVELNTLFTAWVETVYHRRVHTETEQTPLERWSVIGTPTLPTPGQLRDAFLWSEWRTVAKTATVGLHGN